MIAKLRLRPVGRPEAGIGHVGQIAYWSTAPSISRRSFKILDACDHDHDFHQGEASVFGLTFFKHACFYF